MKLRPVAIFSIFCALVIATALGLYLGVYMPYLGEQSEKLAGDFVTRVVERNGTGVGERRLLLFGDSRVALWTPLPSPEGWSVTAVGYPGAATTELLTQFDAALARWNPDLVAIQAGINDIVALTALGDPDNRFEDQIFTNMSQILDLASARGVKTAIIPIIAPAVPPVHRRLVWSDEGLAVTERVNLELQSLQARGTSVLPLGDLAAAPGQYLSEKFSTDMLHLNEEAYAEINVQLSRHLEELHAVQ